MRLNLLPLLFLALSSAVLADHACIEERPNGTVSKRTGHLPHEWFLVGGKSLTDPALHAALKQKFGSKYISGFEEGEFGFLCLKDKGAYVTVTSNEFGVGVDYSKAPPKCMKCNTSNDLGKQFGSGTGLRLGQTKAQVSAIISQPVDSDIVSVEFEETITESAEKVLHTEVLRLEFANDLLIRVSVYAHKEGA
jgi:hypothetical protein